MGAAPGHTVLFTYLCNVAVIVGWRHDFSYRPNSGTDGKRSGRWGIGGVVVKNAI